MNLYDVIKAWSGKPKSSRDAIVKELRDTATAWASNAEGDEESEEDASTLNAAVDLLEALGDGSDEETSHRNAAP